MRISDWSSDVCSSDLFLRSPTPISGANVRSPRLQISPATTGRVFSRLHKRLGLRRSRPLSPSSTPTLPLSAFAQGRWSARPFPSPENREIINARNDFSTVRGLAGVWAALGNVTACDAHQIGRTAGGEGVCQYVESPVGGGRLKNKHQ